MATNHIHTPLTLRQREILMGSLNPARVSSRKGTGNNTLSYMEAWDIKATLIRVFGFGGFSAEVVESKIERILTNAEHGGKTAWVVLASATVRLTIHQTGAIYAETAVSSQAGNQIGEVGDFAMKTAESDALKRCAIYLGTQFGLSLYNDGKPQDVVRVVLAPGAEWPPTPAQIEEYNAQLALNAGTPVEVPQTPQVAPQQPVQGGPNPIEEQAMMGNPNLTPEQNAANRDLLNRALGARAAKDAEQGQAAALED